MYEMRREVYKAPSEI